MSECYCLYYNGNIYARDDTLPGLVSTQDVVYPSRGDTLMELFYCQTAIAKNRIGLSDDYIASQSRLLDSIEVLPLSDIRVHDLSLV